MPLVEQPFFKAMNGNITKRITYLSCFFTVYFFAYPVTLSDLSQQGEQGAFYSIFHASNPYLYRELTH